MLKISSVFSSSLFLSSSLISSAILAFSEDLTLSLIDDLIVSYPEAHDLGVIAVSPATALPDNPYIPSATIRNFGGNDENGYNVEIEITDNGGSQVYIDNVDITETIAITEQKLVEMNTSWTPVETGIYTVTATVTLAGDTYPDNDNNHQAPQSKIRCNGPGQTCHYPKQIGKNQPSPNPVHPKTVFRPGKRCDHNTQ